MNFKTELIALPGLISESIKAAIAGIGADFKNAFSNWLTNPQVGRGVHHSSYIGGGASGGIIEASLSTPSEIRAEADMARALQASVQGSAKCEITINNTMKLDGKVIAKNTTKRQVQLSLFPKSISGGPDSFGSYVGPGTTVYGI